MGARLPLRHRAARRRRDADGTLTSDCFVRNAMTETRRSRREVLKTLGAVPLAAALPAEQAPAPQGRGRQAGAGQGRGRQAPQVQGVVTPSPTAVPGGKPLLTMYSISLQWADYDEAADTAAKAGWPAIGWTARQGGHVLPENVAR